MNGEHTDVRRPDGLTRQFRYGHGELAVIDVTSEFITMNWSTTSPPSSFVELANELRGARKADVVFAMTRIEETYFDYLYEVWVLKHRSLFDELCKFIRFDLSKTRSIAWQRLPEGLVLVGFGESTNRIAKRRDQDTEMLLRATATDRLEPDELSQSFFQLANLAANGQQ